MRKDLGKKSYLFPMPVLIIGTYDELGRPNAMNAAWGGMYDYNQIIISLSKHVSTTNILKQKEFTISFGTVETVDSCDYVGIVSLASDPEKMNKSKLTPIKSNHINAPLFKELPVALECRLIENPQQDIIGEIINVSVDESVITNGNIDMSKFHPISFNGANNTYQEVGKVIAEAFSIGNKLK